MSRDDADPRPPAERPPHEPVNPATRKDPSERPEPRPIDEPRPPQPRKIMRSVDAEIARLLRIAEARRSAQRP